MTTKMLPYQAGFSPRHARTTRPRELAQVGESFSPRRQPPGPNDPVPSAGKPLRPGPPRLRLVSSVAGRAVDVLALLFLLIADRDTRRMALRNLRKRWALARPQSAAQADTEAYEVSRWIVEIRSPALPPFAILRASTLTVSWIKEQLRPDPPVHDLVLYFRLWCLAEGISA